MATKQSAAARTAELARKVRGDWGAISPVTRIVPNKKKQQRIKHKKREEEIWKS